MGDLTGTNVRERVWIEVIDHDEEPPRVIREVFVENGVLVHDVTVTTTGPAPRPAADAALPSA